VSVIIYSGDGFSRIGHRLIDEGVVGSGLVLRYSARWRGIDRKLVPGRYDFTGKNSCRSVLDKFEQADFVNIKVTIYEGAPVWKVASVLAERMETDSAELVALNLDSSFLDSIGLPYLEGYLYPETYFFPWGADLRTIVRELINMYEVKTKDAWSEEIQSSLSHEETVILASIVQAEALVESEMPQIASVYHNRIRRGMKLDADPTVIYGLGGLDRLLDRRDLRKDTPYNTYLRKGLPPTPINSPSLAAIRATLHPAESPYLYFVADGTGRHRFSRTNAEHNRARREIRQEAKARGD